MSRRGNRIWAFACLTGIALWIGATVVAAVVNDDPADGKPVLLAFAAGGAIFFGAVFAVAWWQTRPRPDPELDRLVAELTVAPGLERRSAAAIGAMRAVARTYIVLGAIVTALGLAAILEEGLGVGSARVTLYAMVAIVIAWAAAVPFVLRRARAASISVLTPLGLSQNGATLAGERHGRRVSVAIGPKGSVTRLTADADVPRLDGGEILAYAGRGSEAVWDGVEVTRADGKIVVRREGHAGASWLWDLWLAERLAEPA